MPATAVVHGGRPGQGTTDNFQPTGLTRAGLVEIFVGNLVDPWLDPAAADKQSDEGPDGSRRAGIAAGWQPAAGATTAGVGAPGGADSFGDARGTDFLLVSAISTA